MNRRDLITTTFLAAFGGTALSAQPVDPPRPAPANFAINMLDGSKVSLAQYRGKVIVLAGLLTT